MGIIAAVSICYTFSVLRSKFRTSLSLFESFIMTVVFLLTTVPMTLSGFIFIILI